MIQDSHPKQGRMDIVTTIAIEKLLKAGERALRKGWPSRLAGKIKQAIAAPISKRRTAAWLGLEESIQLLTAGNEAAVPQLHASAAKFDLRPYSLRRKGGGLSDNQLARVVAAALTFLLSELEPSDATNVAHQREFAVSEELLKGQQRLEDLLRSRSIAPEVVLELPPNVQRTALTLADDQVPTEVSVLFEALTDRSGPLPGALARELTTSPPAWLEAAPSVVWLLLAEFAEAYAANEAAATAYDRLAAAGFGDRVT